MDVLSAHGFGGGRGNKPFFWSDVEPYFETVPENRDVMMIPGISQSLANTARISFSVDGGFYFAGTGFVRKYNYDGSLVWERLTGFTVLESSVTKDNIVEWDGKVYYSIGKDVEVLDASTGELIHTLITGDSWNVRFLIVDQLGEVYLFNRFQLRKFDTSGSLVYATNITGSTSQSLVCAFLDINNDIYCTYATSIFKINKANGSKSTSSLPNSIGSERLVHFDLQTNKLYHLYSGKIQRLDLVLLTNDWAVSTGTSFYNEPLSISSFDGISYDGKKLFHSYNTSTTVSTRSTIIDTSDSPRLGGIDYAYLNPPNFEGTPDARVRLNRKFLGVSGSHLYWYLWDHLDTMVGFIARSPYNEDAVYDRTGSSSYYRNVDCNDTHYVAIHAPNGNANLTIELFDYDLNLVNSGSFVSSSATRYGEAVYNLDAGDTRDELQVTNNFFVYRTPINKEVICFNLPDLTERWKKTLSTTGKPSAIYADDEHVYVFVKYSTTDNFFYKYDAITGEEVWSKQYTLTSGSTGFAGVERVGASLFAVCEKGVFVEIDMVSGDLLSQNQSSLNLYVSRLTKASDTSLLLSSNNTIVEFNPLTKATGELRVSNGINGYAIAPRGLVDYGVLTEPNSVATSADYFNPTFVRFFSDGFGFYHCSNYVFYLNAIEKREGDAIPLATFGIIGGIWAMANKLDGNGNLLVAENQRLRVVKLDDVGGKTTFKGYKFK